MAEKFFNKIADDVLKATENIQARFEEGWSVLSTGALPDSAKAGSSASSSPEIEFDLDDFDVEGLSEEELQELMAEHQQQMMENSPLKGIAENVMGNIMSQNIGPQTPMEHFDAFRSAITWSEAFILGLIAFQIVVFLLCLYVSRRDGPLTPRVFMLVFIGAVVKSAEYLNGWGARNWERFATQNYFDSRGVFVGIMLSGPLLLDSLVMLFKFVAEAGSLLIAVKKEEMKHKKKQQNPTSTNKQKTRSKTSKQD